MSVHHKKHHEEGEGEKLIGAPSELIELMIPGSIEREWAIDQIDNEGPKHKQIFSALLLNRLFRMIKTIEKSSGSRFQLQEGYELIKEADNNATPMPIAVPIHIGTDLEKKQIADAIGHAPEHEILVYAATIQAIEWVIRVIENTHKN